MAAVEVNVACFC